MIRYGAAYCMLYVSGACCMCLVHVNMCLVLSLSHDHVLWCIGADIRHTHTPPHLSHLSHLSSPPPSPPPHPPTTQTLRESIAMHNGYEVSTQGDSFFVVFPRVADAVQWSMAVQWRLLQTNWPKAVYRLPACNKVVLCVM